MIFQRPYQDLHGRCTRSDNKTCDHSSAFSIPMQAAKRRPSIRMPQGPGAGNSTAISVPISYRVHERPKPSKHTMFANTRLEGRRGFLACGPVYYAEDRSGPPQLCGFVTLLFSPFIAFPVEIFGGPIQYSRLLQATIPLRWRYARRIAICSPFH